MTRRKAESAVRLSKSYRIINSDSRLSAWGIQITRSGSVMVGLRLFRPES